MLVNELAPRPHSSGHWTMDACATSQFEQLVRALCGLPLGSAERHSDAMMKNLIGDEVKGWPGLLTDPDAKLHLYGKAEARAGRKMGHVTQLQPRSDFEVAAPLGQREINPSAIAAGRRSKPGVVRPPRAMSKRPGHIVGDAAHQDAAERTDLVAQEDETVECAEMLEAKEAADEAADQRCATLSQRNPIAAAKIINDTGLISKARKAMMNSVRNK